MNAQLAADDVRETSVRARASYAQQRLWFIEQLDHTAHVYNVPAAWRLRGPLDTGALAAAVEALAQRHEALRTTLELDGSELYQVVHTEPMLSLETVDLAHLRDAERDTAVQNRLATEAAWNFDLANGPLARAVLIRLDLEDHVLALTLHHVIADGWSLDLLFDDLRTLYAAHRRGEDSHLPELLVQYADYAEWQRDAIASGALGEATERYLQRLSGAPPVLELPTSKPRPPARTMQGAATAFDLDVDVVAALHGLSRDAGCTMFMTILAAFGAVLQRLTSVDRLIIGSPVSGRTRPELERVVGCFVNTLAFRLDVHGDPTFAELLQRVRSEALAAYAYQDVPFDMVVERLNPPRELGRSPVVQVLFSLLAGAPVEGFGLDGLATEPMGVSTGKSQFDLSLEVLQKDDGTIRGSLTYAAELFDAADMNALARSLVAVLEQVSSQPAVRLEDLALLGDQDRLALEAFNQTRVEVSPGTRLHDLIGEQAGRAPNRIAIAMGNRRLTYAELWRDSGRLARRLEDAGVVAGDTVAVLMERSPETIVALVATLRVGAAYLPLDRMNPRLRTAAILDDARPAAVLTDTDSLRLLPASRPATIDVKAEWKRITTLGEVPRPAASGQNDELAYVIYTSGTTGRPKGVQVGHAAVANLVHAVVKLLSLTAEDRVLAATAIAFDIAIAELLIPLTVGARVVLADDDAASDGEALASLVDRAGVTVLQATPSRWSLILQAGWKGSPNVRAICTGEALPHGLAAELLPRTAVLWNLYGPTETTVWSTAWKVCEGPVSVGRPIANTSVYVVDGRGRLVPPGFPGELCIGGAGVARGYVGLPELTAERFVADPFRHDGGRMYRTGDIARWLPDETLQFIGRRDSQVKIHGYRIELEEIEAVLLRHPDVAGAAAAVVQTESLGPRLVAHVVCRSGSAPPTISALRRFAKDQLPAHMIPTALNVVEAIPLTISGKVDRAALPSVEQGPQDSGGAVSLPSTPTEQMVAGIWAEVFANHGVRVDLATSGIDADFFELGGQSLLGAMLLSRLNEQASARLPLRILFEQPTIRGLAGEIDRASAAPAPAGPRPHHPRKDVLLSERERYTLNQMIQQKGHRAAWNMVFYRRLRGRLDRTAFEKSVAAIFARHEGLRTAYRLDRPRIERAICPPPDKPLNFDDLGSISGRAAREARARKISADEAAAPFDVRSGQLMRVRLIRLRSDEHVLLLVAFHMACDDWSIGVITRELFELYAAAVEGREARLPDVACQPGDYFAWRREDPDGELREQALYWQQQLSDLPPPIEVFPGRNRKAVTGPTTGIVDSLIPKHVFGALEELCRAEGLSMYMVFVALVDALLHRYTGGEDLLTCSTVANRARPELHDTVGALYNSVLLRVKVDGGMSFRELARHVRTTVLDAMANQEHEYLDALGAEYYARHSRINVMYRSASDASAFSTALDSAGITVEPFDIQMPQYPCDLYFFGYDDPRGGLGLRMYYRGDVCDEQSARRLLEHLRLLADGASLDPDATIAALPMLTETDRRGLESAPPDSRQGGDAATALDLLGRRFERDGGSAAVVVAETGEEVSCADLDVRATAVARRLVAMGAGPGTVVGVLHDAGADMPAAILGVLRSGTAFVVVQEAQVTGPDAEAFLERTGMKVVVASRSPRSLARGLSSVVVDHIVDQDQPDDGGSLPTIDPDDLAYLINDASEAGVERLLAVSHRGLHRLLEGGVARELRESDVVPQVSDPRSEVFVLEVLGTLSKCGRLLMLPDSAFADTDALGEALLRHGATALLCSDDIADGIRTALGHGTGAVRLALFVTDDTAAPPQALQRLPRGEGVSLLRAHGPAGVTVSCAYMLESPGEDPEAPIIGRVLADECLVLDRYGNPMPPGLMGELFLGGSGLPIRRGGMPPGIQDPLVRPLAADPDRGLLPAGVRVCRIGKGKIELLGVIPKARVSVAEASIVAAETPTDGHARRRRRLWPVFRR